VIPVKRYREPEPTEAALLLGLLIGEGHFGGDNKQPHIVLRMHIRHMPLAHWIAERWPQHKLYGPYTHAGRHYWQMMWRGPALRYGLMPWLESLPWEKIDPHSYGRYAAMKAKYKLTDVPPYGKKSLDFPNRSETEGPLLGDSIPPGKPLAGDLDLHEDEET
jgi:hypothetical protein